MVHRKNATLTMRKGRPSSRNTREDRGVDSASDWPVEAASTVSSFPGVRVENGVALPFVSVADRGGCNEDEEGAGDGGREANWKRSMNPL